MLATRSLLVLGTLAVSPAAQEIEDQGPYPLGYVDVSFDHPLAGTSPVVGRVFYPALISGIETDPDPSVCPCPTVALVHGFGVGPDAYSLLSSYLATWGFIVVSVGTQVTGNYFTAAEDAQAFLHWAEAEGNDPASFLFDMPEQGGDWAVMGHSAGGRSVLYLMGLEERIDVAIPMEPSYVFQASTATWDGALLAIGGELDVGPMINAGTIFDQAESARRRFLVELVGGGHMGPADFPIATEPLPFDEQHRLHRRWVGGILRAELMGEENLYVDLVGEGIASEPLVIESGSKLPPMWLEESDVVANSVVTGLAATPADAVFLGLSLVPVSIPTIYGTLGIDLAAGLNFHITVLDATGITETHLPIPVGLTGIAVHFQGIAVGSDHALLSRTITYVLP